MAEKEPERIGDFNPTQLPNPSDRMKLELPSTSKVGSSTRKQYTKTEHHSFFGHFVRNIPRSLIYGFLVYKGLSIAKNALLRIPYYIRKGIRYLNPLNLVNDVTALFTRRGRERLRSDRRQAKIKEHKRLLDRAINKKIEDVKNKSRSTKPPSKLANKILGATTSIKSQIFKTPKLYQELAVLRKSNQDFIDSSKVLSNNLNDRKSATLNTVNQDNISKDLLNESRKLDSRLDNILDRKQKLNNQIISENEKLSRLQSELTSINNKIEKNKLDQTAISNQIASEKDKDKKAKLNNRLYGLKLDESILTSNKVKVQQNIEDTLVKIRNLESQRDLVQSEYEKLNGKSSKLVGSDSAKNYDSALDNIYSSILNLTAYEAQTSTVLLTNLDFNHRFNQSVYSDITSQLGNQNKLSEYNSDSEYDDVIDLQIAALEAQRNAANMKIDSDGDLYAKLDANSENTNKLIEEVQEAQGKGVEGLFDKFEDKFTQVISEKLSDTLPRIAGMWVGGLTLLFNTISDYFSPDTEMGASGPFKAIFDVLGLNSDMSIKDIIYFVAKNLPEIIDDLWFAFKEFLNANMTVYWSSQRRSRSNARATFRSEMHARRNRAEREYQETGDRTNLTQIESEDLFGHYFEEKDGHKIGDRLEAQVQFTNSSGQLETVTLPQISIETERVKSIRQKFKDIVSKLPKSDSSNESRIARMNFINDLLAGKYDRILGYLDFGTYKGKSISGYGVRSDSSDLNIQRLYRSRLGRLLSDEGVNDKDKQIGFYIWDYAAVSSEDSLGARDRHRVLDYSEFKTKYGSNVNYSYELSPFEIDEYLDPTIGKYKFEHGAYDGGKTYYEITPDVVYGAHRNRGGPNRGHMWVNRLDYGHEVDSELSQLVRSYNEYNPESQISSDDIAPAVSLLTDSNSSNDLAILGDRTHSEVIEELRSLRERIESGEFTKETPVPLPLTIPGKEQIMLRPVTVPTTETPVGE